MPEPVVEIHPEPAGKLGITGGEPVVMESPKGSITLKAAVTPDIHPGVLSIQHGWKEANANMLTADDPRDPISGFPGLKTTPCRVRKIG